MDEKVLKKRIKNPVQLISQSNNCCLLSAQPVQELFSKSRGIAGDVSPYPNRSIYLEKNGNGRYFVDSKYQLKQLIRYIQEIKVNYILKNGYSYNEAFDFVERLYEEFIEINSKKTLNNLLRIRDFASIRPKENWKD